MTGRGRGASSRTAQCRGFDTRREPYGGTSFFSREEGGERVQTQVDNLPNEHGGSSISGFGFHLGLIIMLGVCLSNQR